MSRVGTKPVDIPDGVELEIGESAITAKGKLGELSTPVNGLVNTEIRDGQFRVRPVDESNDARAMWGTTRAVVQNMVTGVSTGFTKELEIVGVGFRAEVKGGYLRMELGYSHDIYYPIPEGITIQCDKPTSIKVSGASKQQVGQVAAEIRQQKAPEPYKGKGIKYVDETILRKEGKKK
jgi:large subunit ribosomal protein L6